MADLVLEGAFVAIVTPFKNGEVDLESLRKLIDSLLEGGINGIVPCGTTGEAATMSQAEQELVISTTIEQVAGRVPVVAGTGSNNTAATIEASKRAKAHGADALLVVAPPYNKPNQEGLTRHFTAIADAVDHPIILYNVPGRTGCRIEVATIARLSKHPRIVAVKDATADMVFASDTIAASDPNFRMFSGDDGTTLPFLAVGGHGCISVVGNVAPRLLSDLCLACREARWADAQQLHYQVLPLFHALFSDSNPLPVKAALALMGRMQNELRPPLYPLSDASMDKLAGVLREAGLL